MELALNTGLGPLLNHSLYLANLNANENFYYFMKHIAIGLMKAL